MLELRIQAGQPAIPLMALPMAIGREQTVRTVGEQIEAMLALLDELDGDPDLEDGGDYEPDPDREVSYSEWHTRGRFKTFGGGTEMSATVQTSDDDEDDDPAEHDDSAEDDDEDCCAAADDDVRSGASPGYRDWMRRAHAIEIGSEDDAEPGTQSGRRCRAPSDRLVAANDTDVAEPNVG